MQIISPLLYTFLLIDPDTTELRIQQSLCKSTKDSTDAEILSETTETLLESVYSP